MLKVVGTEIRINRGDVGILSISAKSDDNTNYTFKVGDVVRFKVFRNKDCGSVELQKDLEVTTEATAVDINLTKEDTKIGELTNKPVLYWYEVELNPESNCQTIIGYDDETGPKIFMLYPEGGDLK